MVGARSSLLATLFCLNLCSCGSEVQSTVDPETTVDPLIGTGGLGFGVGSIVPGPKHPFGLANPAPDTSRNGGAPGFSHCGGYYFEDDEIRGFSQIHVSGTGVPDYGALLIMPVTSEPEGAITERYYHDRFDHRRERASLGEYAVHLLDSDVEVEITATLRTALYRIGYPSGLPSMLVINLDHGLGGGETVEGSMVLENGELVGRLRHAGDLSDRFGGFILNFAMRFSTPPTVKVASEDGRRMLLDFGGAEQVSVQIGLSFVDEAGARGALDAEWANFDFEATRDAVKRAWNDTVLGKVRIEGGADDDRVELYTALYHAYQMPTLMVDIDGRYRGMDGEIHQADFSYYSDFSLWDTYRTAHPLYTWLTPDIQENFNRSLVRMLDDGGHLPRWPLAHGNTWAMVGDHGESMLIDAYLRGVGGFDPERVYSHLAIAARGTIDSHGLVRSARECVDAYLSLGYCPAGDTDDSTSETLENAYNDWMLANFAEALGKTEDAAEFRARSESWKNVFNPATGFTQGRLATGEFVPDFDDELFSGDFIEGNARQWTVYVPYDTLGLAEAMGGNQALLDYLTRFFENAAAAEDTIFPDLWYWHGNEVDIHTAYMFAELGRPDLTERWVSWIMDERYSATPEGLDGNDDGGTLSSWYVFSAAGFYPLAGSDRYLLGVPRFDRMEVDVGDRTLVIEKKGEGNVARVEIDGRALDGPYLKHADLIAAEEIVFTLQSR
jgi:predicted alpha-1,2-mannosidase